MIYFVDCFNFPTVFSCCNLFFVAVILRGSGFLCARQRAQATDVSSVLTI